MKSIFGREGLWFLCVVFEAERLWFCFRGRVVLCRQCRDKDKEQRLSFRGLSCRQCKDKELRVFFDERGRNELCDRRLLQPKHKELAALGVTSTASKGWCGCWLGR